MSKESIETAPQQSTRQRVVIVSGFHDYRTARRGSIQALADALVGLGYEVTFISIRFSPISIATNDHRLFFWSHANKPEMVNGVLCYLWRTFFHPFRTGNAVLDRLAAPLFRAYAKFPDRFIDNALRSASYIVIESGLGIMLTGRARKLNKQARIIYRASDTLDTIRAHPILKTELARRIHEIDAFCLLARKMAPCFALAKNKTYVVPLGINRSDFADIGPSPYSGGVNAVTVGSMLFDRSFFQYAGRKFPNIHFHLIGCGAPFEAPSNVHIYKEMPFKQTLPYIKHANFGIAAYRLSSNSEYLAQSSLKLMQYEYLGVPAVCPDYAVGTSPNRFGYSASDHASIDIAIERALTRGPIRERPTFLSWEQAAERLLNPELFDDTAILPSNSDRRIVPPAEPSSRAGEAASRTGATGLPSKTKEEMRS